MEFKQIQCFVAAAETLNFTTAAERMYLSQPSLSRHIQNLEDELGLQLFIRDRKHVTLTPSGLHLLPVAREICAASARFLVSAKNLLEGDRGFLKVGYQGSARVVLSPILDRFFKHLSLIHILCPLQCGPASLYTYIHGACVRPQSPRWCFLRRIPGLHRRLENSASL